MSESETLRDGARAVVVALRAAGFEALWAGGCVRDAVMGREPGDYDIATSATPQEVQAVFDRTVPIGEQFGVVLVVVDPARQYEVATFRTEDGYSDGRRPGHVRWASAYEDVIRRDFTINGLLYDPIADRVIDHVGGIDDITSRTIRAIGDPNARFSEDRLRMLRAVRFAARFEFDVHATTLAAIRQHAAAIVEVSVERIASELGHILTTAGAQRGLQLLENTGLLSRVLPELKCPASAIARFGDDALSDAVVAWGLALFDIGAEAAGAVMRRLKLSRKHQNAVTESLDLVVALTGYDDLGLAQRKRLVRASNAHRALAIASRTSGDGPRQISAVGQAAADLERWTEEHLFPPKLVDGRDLQGLGLSPGPRFKAILAAIEDAQLEGRVQSKREAVEFALELASTA